VNLWLDLKLLLLLGIANGVPLFAKKILGSRLAHPLDGHVRLADGQPLLGPAKTWRGIVLSLLLTTLAAPVIGMAWRIGLLIAALAMLGDLISSFLKRRLGLASSSMATGLDQIPESLLPMLAAVPLLGSSLTDVAFVTACFFAGEILLSRLLHRVHLRDQPY
jgi:CDP-archaeol synthase